MGKRLRLKKHPAIAVFLVTVERNKVVEVCKPLYALG